MKRFLIFLIFTGLTSGSVFAQYLSLQSAIDTALKNSYHIEILKNENEMAELTNSYAIAGGMPVIGANLSDDISQTGYVNYDGNGNKTDDQSIDNILVAGIKAEMTLYNGKRIVATKQRLSELKSMSEIELLNGIQSLTAEVTFRYYEIVRQEKYLDILLKTEDLAKQKLEIVQTRLDAGLADGADLLQAQSDLNAVIQSLKSQELNILNAKADLASLLNCNIDPTSLSVNNEIEVDEKFDISLIPGTLEQNASYLLAQKNVNIRNLLFRETYAGHLPVLKANTSFDYYQKNSFPDAMMFNYGPGAGITMQVPIYSWNTEKIKTKVAKINVENAELERDNLMNDLQVEAFKQIQQYTTLLEQIEIQKDNLHLARQLLDVVMQQFQLGHATILDLKAAQASYEEASYSLVNLQYRAKSAEVGLKYMVMGL